LWVNRVVFGPCSSDGDRLCNNADRPRSGFRKAILQRALLRVERNVSAAAKAPGVSRAQAEAVRLQAAMSGSDRFLPFPRLVLFATRAECRNSETVSARDLRRPG
jgi:hypothetical protein